MSEHNTKVLLVKRPVPGTTPDASLFKVVEEPVPQPADGQFVVKNFYLSLDPAMRGWMNDVKCTPSSSSPSLIPPHSPFRSTPPLSIDRTSLL
jgi:NADPH-dependent curcumin reductase CurA